MDKKVFLVTRHALVGLVCYIIGVRQCDIA